ncbi:MAG: ribonuclease H family protein [Campylobacterota bacterium]|nr:ribonuclease H family protein [Campylobacterota bacterium]
MKITESFLKSGLHNGVLNKTQLELLGEEFPSREGWEASVLGKELSLADTNLFLFLRGKFPLTVQKQIVENYQLVATFHKEKKKSQSSENQNKPKKSLKNLTIYCDGACQGNPGKAGSGLALYDGTEKPTLLYGDYTPNGTNNTAELHALYKALQLAKDVPDVQIYSDSKYSIDCITNWAYGWKAKGWTKKSGEIKNLELIKEAHILYDSIKNTVTIKHVKGHSGVEGNELADRMAVQAIKERVEGYRVYEYDDINEILRMREG